MSTRKRRLGLAAVLVVTLITGLVVILRDGAGVGRTHLVAYFDNSNGIFVGDEVRIVGVPVGVIDKIEPQPLQVKISFWLDDEYKVPADAKAVILSPSLVTSRAIQLTPAYTSGPVMADNTVIGRDRTAVPVEFDDFRQQLQKLNDALQPTQPGGVSPLGALVNTTADNLRGQGATIRGTIIKLSQAISALGDHSDDLFSTLKNLSLLVSALQGSSDLLAQLNQNLASVTNLVANDPNEVGNAVRDLGELAGELTGFVNDNREALGITADKLASVSQALHDSIPDIKEVLHVAATHVPELPQHLPTCPRNAHRGAVGQQLPKPNHVPMRGNSGRITHGWRTIREAMRPVPGAHHQEPPVQLPSPGAQPSRRHHCPTERGELQRGLDAS